MAITSTRTKRSTSPWSPSVTPPKSPRNKIQNPEILATPPQTASQNETPFRSDHQISRYQANTQHQKCTPQSAETKTAPPQDRGTQLKPLNEEQTRLSSPTSARLWRTFSHQQIRDETTAHRTARFGNAAKKRTQEGDEKARRETQKRRGERQRNGTRRVRVRGGGRRRLEALALRRFRSYRTTAGSGPGSGGGFRTGCGSRCQVLGRSTACCGMSVCWACGPRRGGPNSCAPGFLNALPVVPGI